MPMPTTSLLQRLTAPMSRRTGLAALVGLAAGAFGLSDIDAKKKKKKKGPITVCARGCKHTTLQEAVDAAAPFGEICLKSGEYLEQVSITKSVTISPCKASDVVTIKAPNTAPNESRVFTVILQAAEDVFEVKGSPSNKLTLGTLGTNSNGGIISFGEGSQGSLGSLVLERVTLTGGGANIEGGGIWAKAPGATIRLTDTVIESCTAYYQGAGILMNGGVLTLDGASQIKQCSAQTAAGIWLDEGATLNLNGTSVIGGADIYSKNEAWAQVDGVGVGGGIYARAGTTINMGASAKVAFNKAYEHGAGIFAEQGAVLQGNASCAYIANIHDNVLQITANTGANLYQVNGSAC